MYVGWRRLVTVDRRDCRARESGAVPSSASSTEPIGGSLTVYNAQHESLTQAWVDEFTKQTGVQVTIRNGEMTRNSPTFCSGGRRVTRRRLP